MVYLIEDIDECFVLREVGKLFCMATAVDTDDEDEERRYLVVVKVDTLYETSLDELPENLRQIVEAMIGKRGG